MTKACFIETCDNYVKESTIASPENRLFIIDVYSQYKRVPPHNPIVRQNIVKFTDESNISMSSEVSLLYSSSLQVTVHMINVS
jgi:hypothetical protein